MAIPSGATPALAPLSYDASDYPPGSEAQLELQRRLGDGLPPLIVASVSRAGSTMLYKRAVLSWAEARFGPEGRELAPCFASAAWKLDKTPLIGGVVYKTHDLPDRLPRSARAKVLFTFRKASAVALSICNRYARIAVEKGDLRGDAWFHAHRKNLRGRGEYQDFLKADTLGLEAQVDGWSTAEGVDVLGLRYETMWDHLGDIEAFLGFPVKMRPRRASPRAPAPQDIAEILEKTYGALDRKIAAMPDVFLRTA